MLWREQHLARFDFTGRHTGGGQGSEDARGRAGRQHSLQVCPQVGARALHALARGVGRALRADRLARGSMWQERAGAGAARGSRGQRPSQHGGQEVPPLWGKGHTPRVDERGRVVHSRADEEGAGPDGDAAPAAARRVSRGSPLCLSGSDAADSTMELLLGSCEERVAAPACGAEAGDAPVAAGECAEPSAGMPPQLPACTVEETEAEAEADDDESWSPTLVLSPAAARAPGDDVGHAVNLDTATEGGDAASHRKFDNTSFLEFGCDHDSRQQAPTDDAADDADRECPAAVPEVACAADAESLGASLNPHPASFSPSPRRRSQSPDRDAARDAAPDGEKTAAQPAAASSTNFTPRRARSVAESNAAKVALHEAKAALARLSSPQSSSLSPRDMSPVPPVQPLGQSPTVQLTPLKEGTEENSPDGSALPDSQKAFDAPREDLRQMQAKAQRADQLEVMLQRMREENQHLQALSESSNKENERMLASSAWQSNKPTSLQDERRKFESKIRFLEVELEESNAELSRTKAKLTSSDIENNVLRSQFEKLGHKSSGGGEIYSSTASRDMYSSTASRWQDGIEQREMVVQLDMADAERRALEKGMQALHAHAASLREENLALHQSLQEALAKLAQLNTEKALRQCPACGTQFVGEISGGSMPAHSLLATPAHSRAASRSSTPERLRETGKERPEIVAKTTGRDSEGNERTGDMTPSPVQGAVHSRGLRQWHLSDTKYPFDRPAGDCDLEDSGGVHDLHFAHVLDTSSQLL